MKKRASQRNKVLMKFKTEVRPLNSIKLTETSVCLGVPSKVRIESFFPPKGEGTHKDRECTHEQY